MAANSVVSDGIWPKFKVIQALVLVNCKNEEDQSKNEGPRVVTTFSHSKYMVNFSRHSRAALTIVPVTILLNFKPIQDFMAVLVTCKNKEDQII